MKFEQNNVLNKIWQGRLCGMWDRSGMGGIIVQMFPQEHCYLAPSPCLLGFIWKEKRRKNGSTEFIPTLN